MIHQRLDRGVDTDHDRADFGDVRGVSGGSEAAARHHLKQGSRQPVLVEGGVPVGDELHSLVVDIDEGDLEARPGQQHTQREPDPSGATNDGYLCWVAARHGIVGWHAEDCERAGMVGKQHRTGCSVLG